MHHQSEAINEGLEEMERELEETGTMPGDDPDDLGSTAMERARREAATGRGPQAPF
jgi:hypothetical protein